MALRPRAREHSQGFTLIEIMVILMIVTILIMIAIPQFLRAREVSRARSCVKNLNVIELAKEQYAMDNHLGAGSPMPALAVFCGPGINTYIKTTPVCQSGGEYTVGDLGITPTCSIGSTIGGLAEITHALP